MQLRYLLTGAQAAMLALNLAACGSQPQAEAMPPAQATAAPASTAVVPTETIGAPIELGVSGSGEVRPAREAELVFTVPGTVAEVRVEEGDTVKQGDLLAILDTRPFDQALQQAQAALSAAEAQEAALTEAPRAADAAAARAQVQQAQAALQQVLQGPKAQDLQSVDAVLAQARAGLQSTRDQLSLAKTTAEAQVQQAADTLTQAQARYAQAKNNWDRVQDSGNDPIDPESCDATGKCENNKLNDAEREGYYSAFVQAEAAMRQAENAVQQSLVAAEEARKAEIVGIQAAEQQVAQAQAAAEKLRLPPDQAQVAAAQAQVAAAQAAQARLQPEPTGAQKAIASAGIAQALAMLDQARLNREYAEIRAPFDGVVAARNVDPGDPAASAGPAIVLVDIARPYVELAISDVDIGRVAPGQRAEVHADALPGQVFGGKVGYVAPTATQQGAVRSYLVRVALDEHAGLRPGMSVRVDLVSAGF